LAEAVIKQGTDSLLFGTYNGKWMKTKMTMIFKWKERDMNENGDLDGMAKRGTTIPLENVQQNMYLRNKWIRSTLLNANYPETCGKFPEIQS